jgi:carbamate kinase
VYAVIDKDWASGLLASRLAVDLFLISTGVDKVAIHFNSPQQQDLDTVTVAELEQYLQEGHFAPGSMRPKVEAIIKFVRDTGNSALITSPPQMSSGLQGKTGTRVVRQ